MGLSKIAIAKGIASLVETAQSSQRLKGIRDETNSDVERIRSGDFSDHGSFGNVSLLLEYDSKPELIVP
jgi:hypothetical protein